MTSREQPWMDLDPALVRAGDEREEGAAALAKVPFGRRAFLKGLGISGAVGLIACERLPIRQALPYLVPPEGVIPGATIRYASTCTACPAACGALVSTRDGRPIKLEGRLDHPLSAGGLCAAAQASVRGLFDAGRLRGPRLGDAESTWSAVDGYVESGLAALAGRPLAVLSGSITSPSLRLALEGFLAPHGGRLVEVDPPSASLSAQLEAYELLAGRALTPALRLERVDRLVVFAQDLLGTGPEPVAHTAAYAARKKRGGGFRHIQIEGSMSLTGAAADVRHVARASERRAALFALLRRVATSRQSEFAARALRWLPAAAPAPEWVLPLADDLLAHPGAVLVASGANDVAEQLAVALTNELLGAPGKTLDLDNPSWVRRGRDRDLAWLVGALEQKQLGGLVVLGENPVEQLPNGERLAALIAELPLSVAITSRRDATARVCRAAAAAHHELECWGDAAPRPDVLTIVQPTLRPLFDTRAPLESLLRWSGGTVIDPRLYLIEQWSRHVTGAGWNDALSSGGAGAAWPRRDQPQQVVSDEAIAAALAQPASAPESGLELELIEDIGLGDGRRSWNPWLRELPQPLTRTSWMPAVRLAPSLAERLGIRDGDEVTLTSGEATVSMAARLQPGQHPEVLAVPVGYGVVDGDGGVAARNAFRLLPALGKARQSVGLAASLALHGARTKLPIVQPHPRTEGRAIVAQVGRRDEKPEGPHHPSANLWPRRDYDVHWEMVIDLDACTGCGACVVSCQAENNLPVVGPDEMQRHRDMSWLRIDRYFLGADDNPDVLFEPMLCGQCDNAPCETVCPVAATVHSHDGLNQQAYNRCVGTRYCANNCPYKVRRFNWLDYKPTDPIERLALNPDVVVRDRGVMEKCTFCVQRIQRARIDAKRQGGAPEPQTACQQSCPAQAIRFGDAKRPDSGIAAAKEEPRAFQVLAELGVGPSITYLARVRNKGEVS